MSKVFQSSSISKILSTNQLNTIEVNNDNIIESDSEFREVIKKGYLLTQINLSTIPDIIQDAIDKAILDAKTQTLADSLISTMRQTIENFDDGVYKKTYIDTTITYLEELLTQKASPEIAASIAEAKIAVATAEFATASQVGSLSSRVGSSESEILNVKETINTKDTARATQIEELQSSINQSLSNYSEAIDLYVDVNGNVKSQKIEKLEAGNSISKVTINELNEVVVDENGNYNAMVAKVIFDSDGKIVGFNFSDTNELTTFTINADVFKISNSTNTKTPFTIVGNELLFDGKVSFSNITDKTSIVTMDNVEDAILNNVTTIDGGKIVATDMFINNINAKGGIIADSVRANTIIGNDIYGSKIEGVNIIGARINGAVIKASYLDLDGELEVLTNYHITLAMFNSNPSLYTDAVFISADNEYRIPSLSNLISLLKEVGNSNSPFVSAGNYTLTSELYSYASANIGTNKKAVKARPAIINIGSSPHSSIPENYLYSAVFATLSSGSGYFRFYIGNLLILSVVKSGSSVSYSGLAGSGSIASPAYNNTNTVNLSYGGMTFSIKRTTFYGDRISVIYGGATNLQIIDNWSSGQIRVEANSQTQDGFNSLVGFRLPAITINNMI